MTEITNDWVPEDKFWTKSYYDFQGILYECLDTVTGKIYINFSRYENEVTVRDPITYERLATLKVNQCLFRFEPMEFDRIHNLYKQLSVGDFVRIANSKNPFVAWRRITKIDPKKMVFHGRCCLSPNDESVTKGNAITNIGLILSHIKR